MREVYGIGIGHTAFGRFLDRSVKSLAAGRGSGSIDPGISRREDLC